MVLRGALGRRTFSVHLKKKKKGSRRANLFLGSDGSALGYSTWCLA
jgi:hypothetical protein